MITVTVNVAPTAGSPLVNQATVSGGGSTSSTATDSTIINVPSTGNLTIISAHTGSFTQADNGDTYTLTVTNTGPGATDGTAVMVTEFIPAGLIPTAISGAGWTCTQPVGPCTRADVLAANTSYPAITLTVNVAPNAPASITNSVGVSGGGAPAYSAADPTTINALTRYSNPLAFATTASVTGGTFTNFSVTYTSDNGPSDIASGQVKIDNCYLG